MRLFFKDTLFVRPYLKKKDTRVGILIIMKKKSISILKQNVLCRVHNAGHNTIDMLIKWRGNLYGG